MAKAKGSNSTLTREQLSEQIQQFKSKGGKITKIASGISGVEGKPISRHIKISKN